MGRRYRLVSSVTRVAVSPVDVVRPHPLAWSHAIRLAGGDKRRLVPNRDGSVLVLNNPR